MSPSLVITFPNTDLVDNKVLDSQLHFMLGVATSNGIISDEVFTHPYD